MTQQLRDTCRRLLEAGTVNLIIGYGESDADKAAPPTFVRRAEDVDRLVWNDRCFANLTAYLTRKEVKAAVKIGIVVKGCDERALVVLEQESQIDRANLYVIGMACDGVGEPRAAKCASCDVHMPRTANETLGEAKTDGAPAEGTYTRLEAFMTKSPEERLDFWKDELERCIKCYACRAVCPLCYCNRCLVDKNRPVCIDTSATLKGNFNWHIARAFHLAGRCVGCGECARVCPVGIDLGLLNLTLARAAETHFDYRAGMDPATPPPVGSYSVQDEEDFIL